MGRYVWAFLAFNFYSFFLIGAFQTNTPYIFESAAVAEAAYYGLEFEFQDFAWGDHYLWRLTAAVIATGLVGFLSGAIAQANGGKTAIIANIPSVLLWCGMLYVLLFSGYEIEGGTGFVVISIMAIPLTSLIAYGAGEFGTGVQTSSFRPDTVLGIAPLHWIWGIIPLYAYSLGIIYVVAFTIRMQFFTFNDISMVATILGLLSLIPVFAWIIPLRAAHGILSDEGQSGNSAAMKGVTVAGLLVGGVLVAIVVQSICFWLAGKIGTWWYT